MHLSFFIDRLGVSLPEKPKFPDGSIGDLCRIMLARVNGHLPNENTDLEKLIVIVVRDLDQIAYTMMIAQYLPDQHYAALREQLESTGIPLAEREYVAEIWHIGDDTIASYEREAKGILEKFCRDYNPKIDLEIDS